MSFALVLLGSGHRTAVLHITRASSLGQIIAFGLWGHLGAGLVVGFCMASKTLALVLRHLRRYRWCLVARIRRKATEISTRFCALGGILIIYIRNVSSSRRLGAWEKRGMRELEM
ncbi:uncharacterized protein K452DRAFT_109516 [Aplosporella prunicola CBS 121167]|uniref:Uncharacterized protein n=1 Tax=Aplosporella prunicola CBS 121167 TaxID=1176127 RepID=A0A6A6BU75_9PEZI|nr:uncharacterized protein K452DRAFT_109516 [Aplosporella prunicola CBS 121167]KAF2146357.1 hypothetical protein K452DRAFT_109516 [Aplosporella prunicola CBS 121167]